MGFEARQRILALLKDAIKDNAEVRVVAFELNLPELIKLLVKIGPRLKIILDDSKSTSTLADGTKVTKDKGAPGSAESKAAVALLAAGAQVCRQHMGDLQHNKMIIVHGPTEKKVVLGSTNFSWRGFYVQSNNAVIVCGQAIVDQQLKAFELLLGEHDWQVRRLRLGRLAAAAGARPRRRNFNVPPRGGPFDAKGNRRGHGFSDIKPVLLVGLSRDHRWGREEGRAGCDRSRRPVRLWRVGQFGRHHPASNRRQPRAGNVRQPQQRPARAVPKRGSGGNGVKMHHKFVVIDFDKPTARVYTGSYNFSGSADNKNGENLIVIRDRRIATAYMVEALRIFDAYQFRVSFKKPEPVPGAPAPKPKKKELAVPPTDPAVKPWWDRFWTDSVRIRDRKMFA